jgi:hypothetical protein
MQTILKQLLALIFLSLLAAPAWAGELHVVLNGKAIHLDKGDYNENNWGLGFEYDYNPEAKWITFINGSFFQDSNDNTSTYFGPGMKRRYQIGSAMGADWHFDYGVIAFLMTRKDYKNNNPFPGVLPFISLGTRNVSLNATYIPRVSPKHKQLLFFQVMVRIAEF